MNYDNNNNYNSKNNNNSNNNNNSSSTEEYIEAGSDYVNIDNYDGENSNSRDTIEIIEDDGDGDDDDDDDDDDNDDYVDDDQDDDDDDDDEDGDEGSGGDGHKEQNRPNNDEEDNSSDHLFGRRSKFGGINQGPIKVITTKQGKVGILYESNSVYNPVGRIQNTNKNGGPDGSSASTVTKFEDNYRKGENELYNGVKKITPVYTPDGKIALLYRGDGENTDSIKSKYEPIKNLTNNEFNLLQDNKEFIRTSSGSGSSNSSSNSNSNASNSDSNHNDNDIELEIQRPSSVTSTITSIITTKSILTKGSDNENDSSRNNEQNSIPLNNNRPLSEVLGIKKNQFLKFRISDVQTSGNSDSSSSSSSSNSLSNINSHSNIPSPISSSLSPPVYHRPSIISNYEYEDENDLNEVNLIKKSTSSSSVSSIDPTTINEIFSKTEVVNLAIVPAFDTNEFDQNEQNNNIEEHDDNNQQHHHHNHHHKHKYQHYHHHHHHHHQHQHNHQHNNNNNRRYQRPDLSTIHCAMQILVALVALTIVISMLGAYIKTRIFDQITIMHW